MHSTRKRSSPVPSTTPSLTGHPKRTKQNILSDQLASTSIVYVRRQPNPLLHSAEVLMDVLAFCVRSPTLDTIAVVSQKLSVIGNRLPNLRRVDYIVMERAQSHGRFDVEADEKSTEECSRNEAFEALIAYANFSSIGRLCLKMGEKKNIAKFSRQLWEQLAKIVAKCDILELEGVDFSNLHGDLLARLSHSIRPSTVHFVGCLFGSSAGMDNVLQDCSHDTTILVARPYRDRARHEVGGVTDEGIFRFLFNRQHPAVEVKLSIECATVSKTFLRNLVDNVSESYAFIY